MIRKRISAEERKKEILQKAMVLFTEKGYSAVTMEDLIQATGLSKGGLYYYYKSTEEILYDLMLEGSDYRNHIIATSMTLKQDSCDLDFVAEQMLNKILDDNPYTPVYVELLLAKRYNEKLESLFTLLKEKTFCDLKQLFPQSLCESSEDDFFNFLTDIVNTMILGTNVLGARDNFLAHRTVLLTFFKDVLQSK